MTELNTSLSGQLAVLKLSYAKQQVVTFLHILQAFSQT